MLKFHDLLSFFLLDIFIVDFGYWSLKFGRSYYFRYMNFFLYLSIIWTSIDFKKSGVGTKRNNLRTSNLINKKINKSEDDRWKYSFSIEIRLCFDLYFVCLKIYYTYRMKESLYYFFEIVYYNTYACPCKQHRRISLTPRGGHCPKQVINFTLHMVRED